VEKSTHVPGLQRQNKYSPAVAECNYLNLKDLFGGEGFVPGRDEPASRAAPESSVDAKAERSVDFWRAVRDEFRNWLLSAA
jgi:hypothetical protein